MAKSQLDLVASSAVQDIIRANQGLNLSQEDIRKALEGNLKNVGVSDFRFPFRRREEGCITHLRYQVDGNDLAQITVDGTAYTKAQINNLDSFRDRLQEAFNYGHKISFCFYPIDRKMTMLNLYPCGCHCASKNCKD